MNNICLLSKTPAIIIQSWHHLPPRIRLEMDVFVFSLCICHCFFFICFFFYYYLWLFLFVFVIVSICICLEELWSDLGDRVVQDSCNNHPVPTPSPTENHYPDQVRNLRFCLFFVYLSLFLFIFVVVSFCICRCFYLYLSLFYLYLSGGALQWSRW